MSSHYFKKYTPPPQKALGFLLSLELIHFTPRIALHTQVQVLPVEHVKVNSWAVQGLLAIFLQVMGQVYRNAGHFLLLKDEVISGRNFSPKYIKNISEN
jgi:hypothetical protein